MKRALIVVDFQNDFVDGALGFDDAKKLDDVIYKKILDYKRNNNTIIFTFDTHYDDYLTTEEGRNLPVMHCLIGTSGHQLYGKVATLFDKSQDKFFLKNTFPSLELANYLKQEKYDAVELCGLVSHICVLANAVMVKSALPNALITIDNLATASYDKSLNDKALDIMEAVHIRIENR